jgi:hypothetical protein
VAKAQAEAKAKLTDAMAKAEKDKRAAIEKEVKKALEEAAKASARSVRRPRRPNPKRSPAEEKFDACAQVRHSPAWTPFNVVAGLIVVVGLVVTVIRFTQGLAATTNLSDYNPWGIWIGFDLLVGVALAAGGYVTSAAVLHLRFEALPLRGPAGDPDRLPGLCPGRAGPALRRGPPLAPALPVFRPAGHHLPALRSGGLRGALPDGALHRILAGRDGVARA